jgi:hypothetical protein
MRLPLCIIIASPFLGSLLPVTNRNAGEMWILIAISVVIDYN